MDVSMRRTILEDRLVLTSSAVLRYFREPQPHLTDDDWCKIYDAAIWANETMLAITLNARKDNHQ